MQRTRRLILDYINRHGPATVDDLAEAAGVVPVTVRAHLAVLERDGMITGREVRTGRAGRPRIYYALTPQAREVFPKGYDQLAIRLLRMLDKPDARANIGKEIGAAWAADLHESLSGSNHDQRVAAAVHALDESGCEVEWLAEEGRLQITFHNCPYSNVVAQFPEICDMERTFLEEVIGLPVQVIESGPGCEQCVFVMANETIKIEMTPYR